MIIKWLVYWLLIIANHFFQVQGHQNGNIITLKPVDHYDSEIIR